MTHTIQFLYSAAESATGPALVVGPDMRIAFASQRALDWLAGHEGTAHDPVGAQLSEALPWLPETAIFQVRVVLATGTSRTRYYQCLLANRWALLQIEAAPFATPRFPRAVLVVLRDVTRIGGHRPTAETREEALKRSPNAAALLDLSGHVTFANQAFLELWRLVDCDAALGMHFRALWAGGTAFDDVARAALRAGSWDGDLIATRIDGSTLPVHLTVSIVPTEVAAPGAMVLVAEDTGPRLSLERSLAESEATLRAVLDTRSDATFVLDPAGAVLSANRGAAALLERPAQKIPGEQLSDLLRPDSAELLRLHIEAVRRSARPVEWEDYGFGRTLRVTLRPISDVHGGAGRLILTCVDVTDHNAATDALRDSHRVLAAVIEASSVAIVAVDTEGRIVMWNQAAEQVFGWNDGQASGRPLPELLASDAAAKSSCVAAALSGQNVSRVEASCRRSDGRAIDLLVTAVPVRDALDSITGAVVAAADVTERNRLRAHLRGSQRAGAAIDLAGGVAHGLTNLLQTLTGYAEVLNARSTDHTRVLSVAQDLAQQVRRGAALTRDLTLLSRRTPAFRQVTELGQLLKDTVPTLRRVLPDSVGIRLEPCGNPLPAEVDPVQMTQVLISLAHNAVDAMPDGGVLVLASGSESECVWLELRDSGIGIAPEVLARACEPFFTTKDPFRHPGLGLALAKDTVAEHGGTLHLRSVPGEGTVARIDLPRGAGIPAVNAPVARGFEDLPAAAKGERVLIVEDEDGARQGLWDMLTVLGYRAIAVSSGEEAGALPTEWRFDALVTDVVLPGIAGPELAGGLRDRWPEIKVILMSACAEEDVRQRPSVGAAARFLQKPFGLDALARELRVVLDSPPPMSVAA